MHSFLFFFSLVPTPSPSPSSSSFQAMLLADIRANYGVALSAAIASLGMIAHLLPSRQKIYDAVLKSFAKVDKSRALVSLRPFVDLMGCVC